MCTSLDQILFLFFHSVAKKKKKKHKEEEQETEVVELEESTSAAVEVMLLLYSWKFPMETIIFENSIFYPVFEIEFKIPLPFNKSLYIS